MDADIACCNLPFFLRPCLRKLIPIANTPLIVSPYKYNNNNIMYSPTQPLRLIFGQVIQYLGVQKNKKKGYKILENFDYIYEI